ncbi:MAG: DUF502 domain-containing protein [Bacteroidales bacterium]|nr:DUF502 domain-containing protein [Bacteroidales bacterium]
METKETKKKTFFSKIMRPFLTGILTIFPLVITIIIIIWFINFLAGMIGPASDFGGLLQSVGLNFVKNQIVAYLLGLSATLVLIYFMGIMVQIGLRNQWNNLTDNIMRRIPLISTIYNASKKITSLFEVKDQPDMKAMSPVMCYFGGKGGTAVLALLTTQEIINIDGFEYYSVMIPSSPVPIGGAILYVPVSWVEKVNFNIDGLVNIYVSMGVTGPEYLQKKAR